MNRLELSARNCLGAILLMVTTILNGCAVRSTQINVSDRNPHAYPPSNQIEVVSAKKLSPSRYVTLAKLSVTGAPNQSRAQLLALLEEKAGELGANGLQIVHEEVKVVGNDGPATFNPAGGNYVVTAPKKIIMIQALAVRLLPES